MITGDNVMTATAIAKECGILSKDFVPSNNYEVIDGKRFREIVGGLKTEKNGDDHVIHKVANMEVFRKVSGELNVLASATPEDKVIYFCIAVYTYLWLDGVRKYCGCYW